MSDIDTAHQLGRILAFQEAAAKERERIEAMVRSIGREVKNLRSELEQTASRRHTANVSRIEKIELAMGALNTETMARALMNKKHQTWARVGTTMLAAVAAGVTVYQFAANWGIKK